MVSAPWSVALVSSDRIPSPQLSHREDTVLGFRIHRMLQVEFLQAAQVTIYDYYEPCKHGGGGLGGGRVSREGTVKHWARRER